VLKKGTETVGSILLPFSTILPLCTTAMMSARTTCLSEPLRKPVVFFTRILVQARDFRFERRAISPRREGPA